MVDPFQQGIEANKANIAYDGFPEEYLERTTKLGTRVANDLGQEWQKGWNSVVRVASKVEVESANRLTDLGQFRSRHRRQR